MKLLPKKFTEYLYATVLPVICYRIIIAICATIRTRLHNDALVRDCIKKNNPIIFALWHNRLVYMAYGYTRILKKNKLVAMISQSRDGRLLGKVINLFKLQACHGSSSRGGSEALRQMIRMIKQDNYDCAMAVDGPRGPKYMVQPGVISIAQASRVPIIPVSYELKHKIRLNSWDNFYIPLPFTWGIVSFGNPLFIPSTLSDTERENYQIELKKRLEKISKDGKQWVRNGGTFNT